MGGGGHRHMVVVLVVLLLYRGGRGRWQCVLRRAWVLLMAGDLVRMMVGGRDVELQVGKGVTPGGPGGQSSIRGAQGDHRGRGGGVGGGGGRGLGPQGARVRAGGGVGVGEDPERQGLAAALQDHGAGDPETLLLVGLEHVGEAEALAAHVAGVGLLARVGAAVALHVGPAGEALAADLADERLLSCRDRGQIEKTQG